jgi:hypothetical protein
MYAYKIQTNQKVDGKVDYTNLVDFFMYNLDESPGRITVDYERGHASLEFDTDLDYEEIFESVKSDKQLYPIVQSLILK